MQSCEDLKKNVRNFVSLTSLTPEEFEYILPAFEKAYQQVLPDNRTKTGQVRERKPGGGRKSTSERRTKIVICPRILKELPCAVHHGGTVWDGSISGKGMDPQIVADFEAVLGRSWLRTRARSEKIQEK